MLIMSCINHRWDCLRQQGEGKKTKIPPNHHFLHSFELSAQVKTPGEGGKGLTCPQPGALHTKGLSSPIFAKSLQCNCGRGEEENIVACGFSGSLNRQILTKKKKKKKTGMLRLVV